MDSITLKLPQVLNLKNSLIFARELSLLPICQQYIFDFSSVSFFEPFGMIYLSHKIRSFKKCNPLSKFLAKGYEHCPYAAHMGFFKAFNLGYGNDPGEARGNLNYIPINMIDIPTLKKALFSRCDDIHDWIETRSRRLAQVLTRQASGDVVSTLKYSFREILRNIIEHSESQNLSYCAQYWQTQNEVQLAIMDSGIGIRKSLCQNPYCVSIQDDRDAIQQSLLPGVSGKSYKGSQKLLGPNANAGFGLYMTNRLCRKGGSFFICSGDSGVFLQNESKNIYDTNFQGTILQLVLKTDQIGSLEKALGIFRDEGRGIAKKIQGVGPIRKNAISLLVTKDFKENTIDF